ncbi:hypothetical protein HDV02_000925 [Globomyces sp. JEL0801]|nr:hypothetical protein HDV02_000925 [Globomyces sp. JEL0801]
MTFFDQNTDSFVTIQLLNNEIPTLPFLTASETLVKLLDTMGSAFGPVRSDISGNIVKLKNRLDQKPNQSQTLQQLVLAEKAEKGKTATEGLLWLCRALGFASLALKMNLANVADELSVSFTKAYEKTLSKHHNFLIRPIFSLAMNACPARAGFYQKLAGGDEPKLMNQLQDWVNALENQLNILIAFYAAQNLGTI